MAEETQIANQQALLNQKRGTALVEQHYERQQEQKESKALETIAALLPMLGQKVRILALQECKWDIDRAAALLRKFQTSAISELEQLNKEKEDIQRQEYEKQINTQKLQNNTIKKRKHASSDEAESISISGSSNNSTQNNSSIDSDLRRKEQKKRQKEQLSKKHKKDKKESKDKKKKHRKDKKQKKDKKNKVQSLQNQYKQYGKYGILREQDIFQKKREFYLWSMEVKGIDVENLPKYEERNLFKDYIEDYNTSTLPNEKYYDLEAFEKKEHAKQQKTGKSQLDSAKLFIDDEAERRKEMQKYRQNLQQERLKEAYDSMQMTDKARDMKEQQMLRLQMNLAYKTGNMEKAQQISELLKPEDPKQKGQKKERE